MRMYQWVPEHKNYIQVSTEVHQDKKKRIRRYLYQADDECWYINKTSGLKRGFLKNSYKSVTVPLDGWRFMSSKSKLIKGSSASASITLGRLPQDDGLVTISVVISSTEVVERFPKCAGDYFKGSKYFCGRPVYENKDGMFLYCSDEGKWSIGDKIGVAHIRSSAAGLSPSDEKNWSYRDDFNQRCVMYREADIVIKIDFF